MPDMPPYMHKYLEEFQKQLSDVDELQQYILKSHLIIESVLDSIINLIFSHPEHIKDARFGFLHKVNIARAYGLRKNKSSMWSMILSVNALRNEIAHKFAGEKRNLKMGQLRRLYIAELEDNDELKKAHKEYPDELIAVMACSLCAGFLASLEYDTRALRSLIDGIDSEMNPDQERFPGPAA